MNRTELIEAVAEQAQVSKTAAEACIKATLNVIKNTDRVVLKQFGVFAWKDVKACTRRNPKTGAAVQCPAKRILRFKPSTK